MEDAHLEKTQYGVSGRLFPRLGHNDKQWTFTPLLVRLPMTAASKTCCETSWATSCLLVKRWWHWRQDAPLLIGMHESSIEVS